MDKPTRITVLITLGAVPAAISTLSVVLSVNDKTWVSAFVKRFGNDRENEGHMMNQIMTQFCASD